LHALNELKKKWIKKKKDSKSELIHFKKSNKIFENIITLLHLIIPKLQKIVKWLKI